jgi:hypothetical protein
MLNTFGHETFVATKLLLVNSASGNNYTEKEPMTRMGDVAELERMLNKGAEA